MEYIFNYYQYKKRLNKKNNFFIPLSFVLIIILIGLAFWLKPANYKSEFYFVEIASFNTYNQAINLAKEIQLKGGAGYIYYNQNYKVLACAYNTKNEAKKVANSLKEEYPFVKVFSLPLHKINSKNLNKNKQEILTETTKILNKEIPKLINLSFDLDLKKIEADKLSILLKNSHNNFNDAYKNFLEIFKEPCFNVSKEYLANINFSFKQLTTEQQSGKIKYYLIDIMVNYISFLASFWFFCFNHFHNLPNT